MFSWTSWSVFRVTRFLKVARNDATNVNLSFLIEACCNWSRAFRMCDNNRSIDLDQSQTILIWMKHLHTYIGSKFITCREWMNEKHNKVWFYSPLHLHLLRLFLKRLRMYIRLIHLFRLKQICISKIQTVSVYYIQQT